MGAGRKVYDDTLTAADGNLYIGVPIIKRALGATLVWADATADATVTLELTDDPAVALDDDTSNSGWVDSGETITGPTGAAAGSSLLTYENVTHARARIKIDAAADSPLKVFVFDGEQG